MELPQNLTIRKMDYVVVVGLLVFTLSKSSFLKNILRWSGQKWFALFMDVFARSYNPAVDEAKEELFSSLEGGSLLEIGVGSGANLKHYPPGTSLIVYEPNMYFKDYLKHNLQRYPNVTLERFVVGYSENMKEIPDNSISSVVCTLVLCSVPNPKLILKEVLRVLRPGGKFYVLEHVVAERGTLLYFIQHVLSTFWWIPFDGCSLIRRSWEDIEEAGFSVVKLRKFYSKRTISSLAAEMIRPHVVGIATK